MVFSIITGIPMMFFYLITHNIPKYPQLEKFKFRPENDSCPLEMLPMFLFMTFIACFPKIEMSHSSVFLLFGMVQTGVLINFFDLMQLNFGWGLLYSRILTAMFFVYTCWRCLGHETILIPKCPLKIHWKSIILINLFFFSTGYYMFPYSTNDIIFQHVYIYLLSIEASIWYYTKEFRLYCRPPRHDLRLFHKAYYITVHRNRETWF